MNIGPYEILGELGRGGMGVVYRARHTALGRDVALKVIAPQSLGSPAVLTRFRREAQAAARLAGHPGIVGVHDVGEGFATSDAANPPGDARRAAPHTPGGGAALDAPPVLYLAMDLIEGRPLHDLIAEGELAPRDTVAIVEQVARALAHAHGLGVLHRDVKPANVLIGFRRGSDSVAPESADTHTAAASRLRAAAAGAAGPCAYLSDFGLAKTHGADAEALRLTRSGELLGTPAYMAPEQARGEPCDARSDIYSLGATMYEALAGKPPFGGDSVHAVIARVLRDDPPPLRQVAPHVPRDAETIVTTALARDPAARYPDATAFADDCARFLRGESPAARRSSIMSLAARPLRRHPVAAGLVIAAAASVGVAGFVLAGTAGPDARETALRGTAGALALAERAAGFAAAHSETVLAVREPLRQLEDYWNGVPLPAEARAALVAQIATACGAVAARHPEAGAPAAYLALARSFAAETERESQGARMAELVAAADAVPDDPFPCLVHARACLAWYARGADLPEVVYLASGVRLAPFQESASLRARRENAAAAVARAMRLPATGQLAEGRLLLDFAAAAERLLTGDAADAAARLAAFADEPALASEAARLRGLALYLDRRFREAAVEFDRVGARGWWGTMLHAAHAWSAAATVAGARGEDAGPDYARALAACDAEDAHGSGLARATDSMRGQVHHALARLAIQDGRDPSTLVATGLAAYDRALGSGEATGHVYLNRASLYIARGDWLETNNLDPLPDYGAARADLDRAAAALPDDWRVWSNRALLGRVEGRVRGRRGEDARPFYAAALDDLARALDLEPAPATLWLNRGQLRHRLAVEAIARGEDPTAEFAAALADLEAALSRDPQYFIAWDSKGLLLVARGRAEIARGADARATFDAAIEAYDAALRVSPRDADARSNRAVACRARAEAAVAANEDARAHFEAALADYDAALHARRNDVPTLFNRANLHARLADLLAAQGLDPQEHRAHALADYLAATETNPRFWQAHQNRGVLLELLGRRDEAIGAYRAAMAVVGERADLVERLRLLEGEAPR